MTQLSLWAHPWLKKTWLLHNTAFNDLKPHSFPAKEHSRQLVLYGTSLVIGNQQKASVPVLRPRAFSPNFCIVYIEVYVIDKTWCEYFQCWNWAYGVVMLASQSVCSSYMSTYLVNAYSPKYCLHPCATLVHSIWQWSVLIWGHSQPIAKTSHECITVQSIDSSHVPHF